MIRKRPSLWNDITNKEVNPIQLTSVKSMHDRPTELGYYWFQLSPEHMWEVVKVSYKSVCPETLVMTSEAWIGYMPFYMVEDRFNDCQWGPKIAEYEEK